MKPPHNYTQRCSVAMLSFPTKIVLQIKQDDKFFDKLLSKENSMSKPSFRMVVAVPLCGSLNVALLNTLSFMTLSLLSLLHLPTMPNPPRKTSR
ncbi:hypothetical protein ACSQ67_010538 [Phaseolus vulgaris]